MEGWIKIHRKLQEWEWYTDSNMVHLFIHLLINANREDYNWKGTIIKRGQVVTGREALSKQTGISERTIRTCLNRLKSTSEVTIEATNKYSIITICNYETYQLVNESSDQQIAQHPDQQLTSNRPTTDHNPRRIRKKRSKEVVICESIEDNNSSLNTKTRTKKITELSWRNSFPTYLEELRTAYRGLIHDEAFIATQQKFNPTLDIRLTLEKACTNFWATEAGWKHKLRQRSKDINWKTTLTNAISQPQNKVYNNEPRNNTTPKRQTKREEQDALVAEIFQRNGIGQGADAGGHCEDIVGEEQ